MIFSPQQNLTQNIYLKMLLLFSEQNSFVLKANMPNVNLNKYTLHSQQVFFCHWRVAYLKQLPSVFLMAHLHLLLLFFWCMSLIFPLSYHPKANASLAVFLEISTAVQFHQSVVVVLPLLHCKYPSRINLTVVSLNSISNFLENILVAADLTIWACPFGLYL